MCCGIRTLEAACCFCSSSCVRGRTADVYSEASAGAVIEARFLRSGTARQRLAVTCQISRTLYIAYNRSSALWLLSSDLKYERVPTATTQARQHWTRGVSDRLWSISFGGRVPGDFPSTCLVCHCTAPDERAPRAALQRCGKNCNEI